MRAGTVIEAELIARVPHHRTAILTAAALDNVNLRGNAIEHLLTDDINAHSLGDLERYLGDARPMKETGCMGILEFESL